MKIGVLRHEKVIHRESWFLTGKKFDEGRSFYNTLPIEIAKLRIRVSDFPVCYVSTMGRAIQTATAVYPGAFHVTNALVEVMNATWLFRHLPVPTLLRKILGRIAWYFNVKKMPETRRQSRQRARSFLDGLLAETNENTLLITHGFFMRCLVSELKRLGFKGPTPLFPKNTKLYVFEK